MHEQTSRARISPEGKGEGSEERETRQNVRFRFQSKNLDAPGVRFRVYYPLADQLLMFLFRLFVEFQLQLSLQHVVK